jgi:putative toxin-antitoxin system antitoxin component (TIGR02293 family)
MVFAEKNITLQLNKAVSSMVRRSGPGNQLVAREKNFTYTDLFADRMVMIDVIREGVPYSFFNLIQELAPFSENDWSRFLDISTKSLQRYKQGDKPFKSSQSEKIIEVAEVTNLGMDVFGETDKFKAWLNTPNFSLGNIKPIDLLADSYGKEMVMGELTRINQGILV